MKHSLFDGLTEDFYSPYVHFMEYSENTLLFSEGDSCEHLGIIVEGELTISTLTYEDKEYTINVLHTDDIFGDTLLYANSNKYLGDGILTKKSILAFIEKKDLEKLMENPFFRNNYLHMIAAKHEKMNNRLKLLSQKSIEDRIIYYLINEKKATHSNVISIESKEKLAAYLNIPRPSLSRELIQLKKKGILNYNRKFITLML